jgi:glycosyltransferase involved in cell wall biosynthesis
MTRVLSITTSFPRHAGDAAGSFVAGHACALSKGGASVRVLAPPGDWAPEGVERVGWRPVPGILNRGGGPEALQARPARALVAGAASSVSLVTSALKHAPWAEVVVGHWLVPSGLAALAAAGRSGARVHLYAHGGDIALLERMRGGGALARRLDAGAHLTFVSDNLRARFCALLPGAPRNAHVVLPMGVVDPAPDQAWVSRLMTLASGRKVVATVGRLTRIKGLDVLAAALVGRSDVLWIAAGVGAERAALQQQCNRLGVAFAPVGELAPGARDALLAVADVFVLPSRPINGRTEGTPVSLLEALVSGVPSVASDTGGVAEVAQEAGVRLVRPDDVAQLAEALTSVLGEPDLAALMAQQHRMRGGQYRWCELGALHAARVLGTGARR